MLKEILYVFSKKYKEDVKHIEFEEKMKDEVKLKGNMYDLDGKIKVLRDAGYQSNCKIDCNI